MNTRESSKSLSHSTLAESLTCPLYYDVQTTMGFGSVSPKNFPVLLIAYIIKTYHLTTIVKIT